MPEAKSGPGSIPGAEGQLKPEGLLHNTGLGRRSGTTSSTSMPPRLGAKSWPPALWRWTLPKLTSFRPMPGPSAQATNVDLICWALEQFWCACPERVPSTAPTGQQNAANMPTTPKIPHNRVVALEFHKRTAYFCAGHSGFRSRHVEHAVNGSHRNLRLIVDRHHLENCFGACLQTLRAPWSTRL